MTRNLIKCNSVNYRKGYIEVLGGIHSGCVNLEVWNVHPDTDIATLELGDDLMPDEAVVANTEIELTIEKAEIFVEQLTEAIKLARMKNDT